MKVLMGAIVVIVVEVVELLELLEVVEVLDVDVAVVDVLDVVVLLVDVIVFCIVPSGTSNTSPSGVGAGGGAIKVVLVPMLFEVDGDSDVDGLGWLVEYSRTVLRKWSRLVILLLKSNSLSLNKAAGIFLVTDTPVDLPKITVTGRPKSSSITIGKSTTSIKFAVFEEPITKVSSIELGVSTSRRKLPLVHSLHSIAHTKVPVEFNALSIMAQEASSDSGVTAVSQVSAVSFAHAELTTETLTDDSTYTVSALLPKLT